MVAVLLQPSLSPTYDDQASCRRTSAFLLPPLSQPGIVVCRRPNLLPSRERRPILRIRHHRQIPLADIYSHDARVALWRGNFYLQADEQVELLAGLVVPELRRPELRAVLDKGDVLGVAWVGYDHSPP
jgi:hypothetical protein